MGSGIPPAWGSLPFRRSYVSAPGVIDEMGGSALIGSSERLDRGGNVGLSGRCCGLNGSGDTGLLRVETETDESELDVTLADHILRGSSAYMGVA